MKILVTGGCSGIGKSLVKHLMSHHELTVLDRQPMKSIDANFYSIDLSVKEEIESFFLNTREQYDALINAAGVREIVAPHQLDLAEWEWVQKVNVTAPFLLSKILISRALECNQKLSIINIASISGLLAEPNRAAYVSSKHALIGLTKQLAFQYGEFHIRVNAIAPGIIETPLTADYFEDPLMKNHIKKNTPLSRWGQPEHLHSLIDVCLMNEYMTGSVLVCDGGWTCGKAL